MQLRSITLWLDNGDPVPTAPAGRLWRVVSGALHMQSLQGGQHGAEGQSLWLAQPGDYVGWERLTPGAQPLLARAITPVTLEQVCLPSGAEQSPQTDALLRSCLLHMQQRFVQMASLRLGSVGQRIRALLLLVAEAQGAGSQDQGHALPSLSCMARIVGARQETVSRALSELREQHLLSHRRPQGGVIDLHGLRSYPPVLQQAA